MGMGINKAEKRYLLFVLRNDRETLLENPDKELDWELDLAINTRLIKELMRQE